MKQTLSSLLLLLTLVSCGNPHIYSSSGGLEKITPPISAQEDPSCGTGIRIEGQNFYASSGEVVPSLFAALTKCKDPVTETFNTHPEGNTSEVSNPTSVLHHRTENPDVSGKVIYLEDLFSSNHEMAVMSQIEFAGVKGKDHGVNSLNRDDQTRDALVWSFQRPVSFWGGKFLALKAGATIRLFDCQGSLLRDLRIAYPDQRTGEESMNFVGFVSFTREICHVSVSAANLTDSVAVDDVVYGF